MAREISTRIGFAFIFITLFSVESLAMKNLITESTLNNHLSQIPETEMEIAIKRDNDAVADRDRKFLIKSADARMMDAAEGKLATEKGTTKEIRDYGQRMLTDQGLLLAEINKLAMKKGVEIPNSISEKKEHFRKKLAEEEGKHFDKRFIRMITIDHKRDLRMFRRAEKSTDEDIAGFAKKFLPVIQSHLDGIKEIKKLQESGITN
ncbi:MAG: DUF4142 domain-containing protein [Chitinophagaceae bacterium]|nr:DUF4142 domain-containing protein [Chitinophagaceae bacterium]